MEALQKLPVQSYPSMSPPTHLKMDAVYGGMIMNRAVNLSQRLEPDNATDNNTIVQDRQSDGFGKAGRIAVCAEDIRSSSHSPKGEE